MPKGKTYKTKKHPVSPLILSLQKITSEKLLCWFMRSCGYTLEDIAKELGIHHNTVSNWLKKVDMQASKVINQTLYDKMDELWGQGMLQKLAEADPWILNSYGKERGYLRDKKEIDMKISPEETKRSFLETLTKTTGVDFTSMSKPKNRFKTLIGEPQETISTQEGKDTKNENKEP